MWAGGVGWASGVGVGLVSVRKGNRSEESQEGAKVENGKEELHLSRHFDGLKVENLFRKGSECVMIVLVGVRR